MKNQPHNSTGAGARRGKGAPRGLIAVAVLAALSAGYAAYWFFLAGQVRDGIGQWAADRRAEGYKVDFASVGVGGFPFTLEAVIAAPAITAPGRAGPWSWQGPMLLLGARPWALTRVRVRAPGRHRITVPGREKPKTVVLDAGALTATLDFNPGPAAFTLFLAASDIVYSVEPVAGLGRTTKRLTLNAAVKGDLPRILDNAALAGWRDGGGTLDVSGLDIGHGPLDLTGDGTGALDAGMQPIGAFTLRVRGFNEALDRLKDARIIKPKAAALMKTVLGMMARGQKAKPGAGAEPESRLQLKVPLSLQDRKVYIGPVAVAEVPVVRWPQVR